MIRSAVCAAAISAVLAPLALSPALATDYQGVQPAALDQPRIYAYLSLTPGGPPQQFEETFNIEAFFDTGASGILLSNNTAAFLGLAPSTYNDQTVIFSDVGVVGSDNFHVSPQVHFGLAKYHPSADVDNIETYSTVYNQVFGPVRTQMGPVEPVVENPLLENLDVIGIPLMHNKVVVMDPRPVNTFLDTMRTYVYNPNTPFNPAQEHSEPGIPVTDRHIRLSYGNFERFTTINPAGAPGPTLRDNPFVGPNPVRQLDPNPPPDNTPGIKSCYTNLCTTGSWLLDTGAAASIISTAQAGNVNVTYDPAHPMGSADPRLLGVPEDEQFQLTIGGVGGTTKIAGFFLDSMLLRTIEGNAANDDDPNHIRFLKAPVLVGDITIRDPQTNQTLTLDGILGMNFFVASAFVSEGAEGEFPFIGNLTRGVFDWVVFDQPNGRLGLKEGVIPEQGRPSWFGNIFANEGEWDVEVSDNWIDGGSPSTYQDGDHVIFSDAIWSNRVRITEPVAPGSMTFTNSDDPDSGVNFTFRGEAIGGFTNIEKIGTGRVTFFNSNTYKGTTNIQHGLIEFLAPQDIGDVNVAAGASVHFGAASHIWTLRVADGEASVSSGRGNTLVTQGVEISGTGRLNLADNAIIIKVDPEDLAATVADVNSMVARGLADDTGLVSGMGLANRRLGVIRNNINGAPIYTSFFGESGLSGDEVLVLYTVIGDLNLDQAVTISDFIDLAAHFNSPGTWQDGDVNYDGMVTISDFIDLASNFNTTYSGEVMLIDPAHAQMLADFAAANVPEPSVMLLSLHSLFLLRRRRRTGI